MGEQSRGRAERGRVGLAGAERRELLLRPAGIVSQDVAIWPLMPADVGA